VLHHVGSPYALSRGDTGGIDASSQLLAHNYAEFLPACQCFCGFPGVGGGIKEEGGAFFSCGVKNLEKGDGFTFDAAARVSKRND